MALFFVQVGLSASALYFITAQTAINFAMKQYISLIKPASLIRSVREHFLQGPHL